MLNTAKIREAQEDIEMELKEIYLAYRKRKAVETPKEVIVLREKGTGNTIYVWEVKSDVEL